MKFFELIEKKLKGKSYAPHFLSDGYYAHCKFRSFGIYALDYMVNHKSPTGGMPRGKHIEIYSPEGAGKTTTAIVAAARTQKYKDKNIVLYLDFEQKFNLDYALHLGLNPEKTVFHQPHNGEEGLEMAAEACNSDDIGLIVVDSIPAIASSAELSGSLTDANIGSTARLLAKMVKQMNMQPDSPTVIWINQLRDNIGVIYGPSEKVPGGRAVKYAAMLRLDLRIDKKAEEGQRIKYKAVKNQTGGNPYQEVKVALDFTHGFERSNIEFLLDKGQELKLVKKEKKQLIYDGVTVTYSEVPKTLQRKLYKEIVETEQNINGPKENTNQKQQEADREEESIIFVEDSPEEEGGEEAV